MKHFYVKILKNFAANFQKVFFLTILLVSCNNSLFAQCKLEKSKDEYSSSQSVSSHEVTLASVFPLIGTKKPWDLVMSFLLVDSTCTIIVTHKDQASSSNLEYIYFKFKDGSIIKKENPFDAGTYNTGLGYRFASTGFMITKDELKQFGSVDLLKFQASLKYNINYPLVDEEIKQKNIDKIRKDAACMLDEFNSVPNVKKEVKKEIKQVEYVCEYLDDQIDPFTKQRRVDTKGEILYDQKQANAREALTAVGNNTNGINGIQFERSFWSKDQVDNSAVQNALMFDHIDLLLENDEVVSLTQLAAFSVK